MNHNFLIVTNDILNQLAISEVIKSNELTYRFGLMLTTEEATTLIEKRTEALNTNGRIELSGSIINKLIFEFCDSPYLSQSNYATTINELVDIFYYYKNETLDKISDDELLSIMKLYFNENCQGSVDLLRGRELDNLARNIRNGVKDYVHHNNEIAKSLIAKEDDDE